MPITFRIITLGCKVNQYESAHLAERLKAAGCRRAEGGEEADITIVNTCIVTQRASYQSRQAIRKAVRENPSGVVAAAGCYAQVFPEELAGIEGLELIADNASKSHLPEAVLGFEKGAAPRAVLEAFKKEEPFDFMPVKGLPDRTRAFLKIQDGCESFCTYCIVPYARGPIRSLGPQGVVRALESLVDEGHREVVLTGIHLGKYGADLQPRFELKSLLRLIGKGRLPLRIRLSSIEPNEVDAELIEMVAGEEWLCRHFHIPLQSGDDGILKRMNRTYRARDFAGLIETVRKRIPLAGIGVDVMVGFPGEDEGAYRNTHSLIRGLPVSYLHVFPYSPRKGTPAAAFPAQVDPKTAKDRVAEMRTLGQEKRRAFYRSCLGKEFVVLAEGWHSAREKRVKGLSDNYLPMLFSSRAEIKNRLVCLLAEKVEGSVVIGTLMEAGSR